MSELVQKMKLKFRWNTHKEKLFNVRSERLTHVYIETQLRVHIEIILRDCAICNCNYRKTYVPILRCLNERERKVQWMDRKHAKLECTKIYVYAHELVEVISEKNNCNFSLNLSPHVIIMAEFSQVSEMMDCDTVKWRSSWC